MLIFMLSFVGSGAKAQIQKVYDNDTKAEIYLYFRFTDMAQIRDITLKYKVNGTEHTLNNYTTETKCKKKYFKFTITNLEWDATNKCLKYPVLIDDNSTTIFNNKGLSWREGMISSRKYNHNKVTLWGDEFFFVQQYFPRLTELTRYDYVTIDKDMEETMMYEYDMDSGISTPLTLSEQGICTWERSNQEFQHVGKPNYNMNEYPYRSEVVLARKSAYMSYQYNNPDLNQTYGATPKNGTSFGMADFQFGTDDQLAGDDVFHACADGEGSNDVIFKTLRSVDESKWPTGCTATRSAIMQSYNATEGDFDGLVGHLRFTLTPKTKRWKAETWVEMTNTHPDGWATFCTPYDVKVPTGLLVIVVDGLEENKTDRLHMISMADHPNIPANTGVMVKGTGTFRFLPADAATIEADRTAYNGKDNKLQYVCFKPNLTTSSAPYFDINHLPYSCSEGTHYVLTYDETNKVAKFVVATEHETKNGDGYDDTTDFGHIQPFKSYLCFNLLDPARELIAAMPDETDGIEETTVNLKRKAAANGDCFDLTGRKYDSQRNLPHGIYIINGRKVAF